jgi:NADH-quinone oxidoreductase subunit H
MFHALESIGHWLLYWPGTRWLFLVMLLVMPLASLLTWAERRQSAMMQDRLGPNRANIDVPYVTLLTGLLGTIVMLVGAIMVLEKLLGGTNRYFGLGIGLAVGGLVVAGLGAMAFRVRTNLKLFGILHFIADAIKMIFKEDFVPNKAHKPLFSLAPILALAPVFIAVAIIPFGPTIYPDSLTSVIPFHEWKHLHDGTFGATGMPKWSADPIPLQMLQIDFGLLFYFAILTVANYGSTIAGWASYNKWALLGGLRSSSQMMSYEVSMGLSLMGVFVIMGTLEPGAMVLWQGSNPINWGWAVQPLAMILFFTAAIAETKRGPFDLPEGEPEIIGYFVEYSGMRWGMFFLAEFIEIVFISMIMTTIFFGGYNVPFLDPDGFRFGGWWAPMPHIAVALLQLAAFGIKVVFFCWLQLTIRWTLPRFRVDQLMHLGWKWLLPLSLFNVLMTAGLVMAGLGVLTMAIIQISVLLILIIFAGARYGESRAA